MLAIIVTNYRKKAAFLALIIFFQIAMIAAGKYLWAGAVPVQYAAPLPALAAQQFEKYESLQGKFSFDYPSTFIIQPQELTGSDILYHIGFRSKDGAEHGFVQVWNLPGTLEEFLRNARKASQQTFRYFKSGSMNVNGVPGYYWDYSVLAEGSYYKGNEVFLKKDGHMYRMSYFVPESEWNKQKSELFKSMVTSFKILQ